MTPVPPRNSHFFCSLEVSTIFSRSGRERYQMVVFIAQLDKEFSFNRYKI